MQVEMHNRQQEIMERAKELQIREAKHELEKAELVFKAQKVHSDMERDIANHHLEKEKARVDNEITWLLTLAASKAKCLHTHSLEIAP